MSRNCREASLARAERWRAKGCHTAHGLPQPLLGHPSAVGPEGPRGGKRGDPATLLAQVPELTAEGCTGMWNPMVADEFAGEADVQQVVPVLLVGAWLHGDGRPCGAEGQGA